MKGVTLANFRKYGKPAATKADLKKITGDLARKERRTRGTGSALPPTGLRGKVGAGKQSDSNISKRLEACWASED